MSNCPDCGHPKQHHSPLVGCLHDGDDICACDRSFKEEKTIAQAHAERDDAMAKAERGTESDWATEAISVIHYLRDTADTWTPDDIWVLLEERRVPPPREPRALGPILKAMSKGEAATIRAVGFTESKRRHGAPVRVYVRSVE